MIAECGHHHAYSFIMRFAYEKRRFETLCEPCSNQKDRQDDLTLPPVLRSMPIEQAGVLLLVRRGVCHWRVQDKSVDSIRDPTKIVTAAEVGQLLILDADDVTKLGHTSVTSTHGPIVDRSAYLAAAKDYALAWLREREGPKAPVQCAR
jgi:hypothetical protein